jgi:prevent-host-death family protein
MKRVTASEARRNWFQLLDEVAAGGVVVILRKGRRIVLRSEEPRTAAEQDIPDYSGAIRVPDVAAADRWSWEWGGPEADLHPRDVEDA